MTTQPVPDGKDWTWVLDRACPECGFDAGAPGRDELAGLAREVEARWQSAWAAVREPHVRPQPDVWSPLEYACHVRDVYALAVARTTLMRDQVDPVFADWDQDATAVAADYASSDPERVDAERAAAAGEYAALLATVRDEEWDRPGQRSNGSVFTVESFTRYLLHDPAHHLTDICGARWR